MKQCSFSAENASENRTLIASLFKIFKTCKDDLANNKEAREVISSLCSSIRDIGQNYEAGESREELASFIFERFIKKAFNQSEPYLSSPDYIQSLLDGITPNIDYNPIETINDAVEQKNQPSRGDTFMVRYGTAVEAKTYFELEFKKAIINAFIVNREENREISSVDEANKNIRDYQQTLISNIINYLKSVYNSQEKSDVDVRQKLEEVGEKLFLDTSDGINTALLDEINLLAKEHFNPSSYTDTLIRRDFVSNSEQSKLKLNAFNSYLLLSNFDYQINKIFRKVLDIDPKYIGKFSTGTKYSLSGKETNVLTSWNHAEILDSNTLMDDITNALIETSPMYNWQGIAMSGRYLGLHEFTYISSKIKSLGDTVQAKSINFDRNFKINYKGEFSEEFLNTIMKHKTLAGLIAGITKNAQETLPLLFELAANTKFYNNNKKLFEGFYSTDKNLIYTVYKNMFSKQGSLYSVWLDNPNSSYYKYITGTINSITSIKYLEYRVDPQGHIIRKELQDVLEMRQQKLLISRINGFLSALSEKNYQSLKTDYNIAADEKQLLLSIPLGNGRAVTAKVSPQVKGLSSVVLEGSKIEEKDFTTIYTFLDRILNIGIKGNSRFLDNYFESKDSKITAVEDLVKFASSTAFSLYYAKEIADRNSETGAFNRWTYNELSTNVKKVFGSEDLPRILRDGTGSISLVRDGFFKIVDEITRAESAATGSITSGSINDAARKPLPNNTTSKLGIDTIRNWIATILKHGTSALRNLAIVKHGDELVRGIDVVRDYDVKGIHKIVSDFTPAESYITSLLYDYVSVLSNEGDYDKIATFITSNNADKTTSFRLKVALGTTITIDPHNPDLPPQTKKLHEFSVPYLKYFIKEQLGAVYSEKLSKVIKDYNLLSNFSGYDINPLTNFKEFNDAVENPKETLFNIVEKYNESHTDQIELIDQVHYVGEKGTNNVRFNRTSISMVYRNNPEYFTGVDISAFGKLSTEDEFWKEKDFDLLYDLVDNNVRFETTDSLGRSIIEKPKEGELSLNYDKEISYLARDPEWIDSRVLRVSSQSLAIPTEATYVTDLKNGVIPVLSKIESNTGDILVKDNVTSNEVINFIEGNVTGVKKGQREEAFKKLSNLGYNDTFLRNILNNVSRAKTFLYYYELSHKSHKDDLILKADNIYNSPDKVEVEVRAISEALQMLKKRNVSIIGRNSGTGRVILAKLVDASGKVIANIVDKYDLDSIYYTEGNAIIMYNNPDFNINKMGLYHIELNPIIEKHNLLSSLFSEEYKLSTIGSVDDHPFKGDINTTTDIQEEAARKSGQDKRGAALTANHTKFQQGQLDGVGHYYHMAAVRDLVAPVFNISGFIDKKGATVTDGATFVRGDVVILENASLNGSSPILGFTKKTVGADLRPSLASGIFLKTACFGLYNDRIRNSIFYQVLNEKMLKGKWTLPDEKTALVLDITKDYEGTDLTDPESKTSYLPIYIKNGDGSYTYREIAKSLGNNQYEIHDYEVVNGERSDIYNTKIITVDNNFDLYNLFGGYESAHLDENGLPTTYLDNSSFANLVLAENRVGIVTSKIPYDKNINLDSNGSISVEDILHYGDIDFDAFDKIQQEYFSRIKAVDLGNREEHHIGEANTLQHTRNVLNSSKILPIDDNLRQSLELSALFHDLGKPFHEEDHGFRSLSILNSLFSDVSPLVKLVVRYHMIPQNFTLDDAKNIIGTVIKNKVNVDDFIEVLTALNSADILRGRDLFYVDENEHRPISEILSTEVLAKRDLLVRAKNEILADASKSDKNNLIKTQDDLYQPMKYSGIHYAPTTGALKQGAANINDLNFEHLSYFKYYLDNTGIQLSKEEGADGEELSLMTQVMSAIASRGYSHDDVNEVYNALAYITRESINGYAKGYERIETLKDPSMFMDTVSKVICRSLLSNSSSAQMALATTIRKELLALSNDGKTFTYDNVKGIIPFSNPKTFSKFVSTIAADINKNGIRQIFPGIMSVLNPSHEILKLYGGRLLSEWNEGELHAEQLKRNMDISYSIAPSKMRIGRTYNFSVDGVMDTVKLETPEDYWNLKNRYLKAVNSNKKVKLVENIEEGRNLGAYNITFSDENGNEFNILDLNIVHKRWVEERQLEDDEKTSKRLQAKIENEKFQLENNPDKELELKNDTEALRTISFRILEGKINIKKDIVELQNTLAKLSGTAYKVKDENGNIIDTSELVPIEIYDIDKDGVDIVRNINTPRRSITTSPYEMIMSQIYAKRFGITGKDTVHDVLDDPNFFLKKLLNTWNSKVADSNFDIELKRLNGKHIYLRGHDSFHKNSTTSKVPIETENAEGKIFRISDSGKRLYQLSSENDEIYKDVNGNEIIVTDNIPFYISSTQFNSIRVSSDLLRDYTLPAEKEAGDRTLSNLLSSLGSKTDHREVKRLLEIAGKDPKSNLRRFNETENSDIKKVRKILNSGESISIDYMKSSAIINMVKRAEKIRTSFSESLNALVARIPCQTMQSFMPMRCVAFDPYNTNNIYVSHFQIWLQGSDFDIDAPSIMGYNFGYNGMYTGWSKFFNLQNETTLQQSKTLPFPTGKSSSIFYVPAEGRTDIQKDVIQKFINALNTAITYNIIDVNKLDKVFDPEIDDRNGVSGMLIHLGNILKLVNHYGGLYVDENESSEKIAQFKVLQQIIDAHNLSLKDLATKEKIARLQNFVSSKVYSISIDPINQVESQVPLDVPINYIKELTKQVKLAGSKNTFGNIMQIINTTCNAIVGKKDVSIVAAGIKAFFALTQYYNTRINFRDNGDLSLLSMNTKIGDSSFDLLANTLSTNIEFLPEELKMAAEKSNQNIEDVALIYSGLLSLATDNAKDPTLYKINASENTIGMYLYGLSAGVPFDKLIKIMTSEPAMILTKKMTGNVYYGDRADMNMENSINSLKSGYIPGVKKIGKLVIFDGASGNFNGRINEVLKQSKGFTGLEKWTLEDLEKFKASLDHISVGDAKVLAKINEYLHIRDIVLKSTLDGQSISEMLVALTRGGNELKKLTSLLGLNTHFKVPLQDQLSFLNNFERLFDDTNIETSGKTSVLYRGEIYPATSIMDKVRRDLEIAGGQPVKLDLERFVTDETYRNNAIQAYNAVKTSYNILDVIWSLPHYREYLTSMYYCIKANTDSMVKYRFIRETLPKIMDRYKVTRNKERIDKIVRGISSFADRCLVNSWLLTTGKTFEITKDTPVYNKSGKITYAPFDGEYMLGTKEGNATFIRWMNERVIPDLKAGVYGPDAVSTVENEFIKDLILTNYTDPTNSRSRYVYTLNIDMLPSSDDDVNKLLAYRTKFDNLNLQYYGQPVKNLFFLYDLINFGGSANKVSMSPIFESMYDVTGGIAKEFNSYISKFDTYGKFIEGIDYDLEDLVKACAPVGSTYGKTDPYYNEFDPKTRKVVLKVNIDYIRKMNGEEEEPSEDSEDSENLEEQDAAGYDPVEPDYDGEDNPLDEEMGEGGSYENPNYIVVDVVGDTNFFNTESAGSLVTEDLLLANSAKSIRIDPRTILHFRSSSLDTVTMDGINYKVNRDQNKKIVSIETEGKLIDVKDLNIKERFRIVKDIITGKDDKILDIEDLSRKLNNKLNNPCGK
jgi:hypothetical protein